MRIPWSIAWRSSCLSSTSQHSRQSIPEILVQASKQQAVRSRNGAPLRSLYQIARKVASNRQLGVTQIQKCKKGRENGVLEIWRSRISCKSFSTSTPLNRVTTKVPKDYDPDKGLPFRKTDLTKEEVAAAFGPTIDPVFANQILRVQHGRRLAGIIEATTLELPPSPSYSPDFPEQALAWLRKNVPVDEDAILASMVREEQQRRESALAARAEQLGIYKAQEDVQINGQGRQSKSGLDMIREQNEARLDALEKEKKEKLERQAKINPAGTKQLSWRFADLQAGIKNNPEWIEAQRKGAVTTSQTVPEMSKMRRLLPSLVVTLFTIGASIIFAKSYIPPSKSSRLFPDIPPAAATILTIMAVNVAVFLAWKKPSLWKLMNRYFLQVPVYPYAITSITNIFSHQQFIHLALNMTVLWMFGTKLHDDVGRGNFLAIYLASGAMGSMVSLSRVVLRSAWTECSLGASGGVCGVVAAWCCVNSDKKFSFIFLPENIIPPLDSMTVLALIIGVDLLGSRWRKTANRVDVWAHMGGYAAGITGAQLLKDKIQKQRLLQDQRRRNQNRNWMEKIKDGNW